MKSIQYFKPFKERYSLQRYSRATKEAWRNARFRRQEKECHENELQVVRLEWNKRAPTQLNYSRTFENRGCHTQATATTSPAEFQKRFSIRKRRSLRKVLHQVFMRGEVLVVNWWSILGMERGFGGCGKKGLISGCKRIGCWCDFFL